MRPLFLLASTCVLGTCSLPRHSVSGQSAGGSMSIQHLVAFSSKVDGCAIAAGSPYGCGSLPSKTHKCSTYIAPRFDAHMEKYLRDQFSSNLIDDPANLKTIPTVLFSGKNDWTVYTQVMRSVQRQLKTFMPESMLTTSFDSKASHVWSIDHGNCSCGACPYDGGAYTGKNPALLPTFSAAVPS